MPRSGRTTSVPVRLPLNAATADGMGSRAVRVRGTSAPRTIHTTAVSTGLEQASATIVTPATRRSPPPRTRPSTAPVAVAAASSSPVAATPSATPGQATTPDPPVGATRLTRIATSSPSSATPHPAATSTRWRRRHSATSAASRNPAVTHTGGTPGPPGDRSSSDRAGSAGSASPGRASPVSSRNRDGWANSAHAHGPSSSGGVTTTIATLTSSLHWSFRPPNATAISPPITRMSGHTNGTNAMTTASSSAADQAARLARAPWRTSIFARNTPSTGSTTMATAVPSRPAATAPVATGSSAYEAASQTRASGCVTVWRVVTYTASPANGTQPSNSSPTAAGTLPNSTVATAATTAVAGGAASADPRPTACQPARYCRHRSDAPPVTGTSAPPPSRPALFPVSAGTSSDRSAASVTRVSAATSSTPGWVSTRHTGPRVSARRSSSPSSSTAPA